MFQKFTAREWFLLALAVIVTVIVWRVAVQSVNVPAAGPDQAGIIERLQNGWNAAKAALLSEADMRERVEADAAGLQKKNKKLAAANVKLQLQLKEIIGEGDATYEPNTPDVARFEDQFVSLQFNKPDERFNYWLKPRPVWLTLIGQHNGTWSAKAYDPATEKEIAIGKLDVYLNDKKPGFFQKYKVGLTVGYLNMPYAGAGVGGQSWRVRALAGYKDELKWGACLDKDLW